jgi:large-conductance mechanosensitive channel
MNLLIYIAIGAAFGGVIGAVVGTVVYFLLIAMSDKD